ncbi:MAG TPA: FapA family protein [Candidatus Hydrogenedentes bacterium]|jgi:hypothetical protein|nr:FapA family protein [Candidatus Hydrogenedentota bacterium]HPJ99347.1 FapA family protein [Candidatus Hydrogenedentota bacterium]
MSEVCDQNKDDVRLSVTVDRLAVLFSGTVDEARQREIIAAIIEKLTALGVTPVPSEAGLWKALSEATPDEDGRLTGVVLVAGTAPQPSKDGWIEWPRDFFSSGFVVNEQTGAVNYRERIGDPTIQKGELIARVWPAEPGQDGQDVFGRCIPAATPKTLYVRCGTNVEVSEDGIEYRATRSGRVRYSRQVLSVDRVYIIDGNVGLASGNIDHTGAVFVEGDVEAEARVRSVGDVEVRGIVEGADIDAGGNLFVRRGITGGGHRHIKAGGRVQARFLVETNIEAGDDVWVERESINSTVFTKGSFIMPGGRLVGGSVVAQGSIRVRQAGSEGLVRTRLAIELDPALTAAIGEKDAEIKRIRSSLMKIKETLSALKRKNSTLSDSAREALTLLAGNIEDMRSTLATLESEREELLAQLHSRGRPQIIVRTVAYPETIFDIYTHRVRLRETLLGPVRAVVGKKGIEFQAIALRAQS